MTLRKKYRIALIEPSDIVCAGIKAMITPESGLEIASTAADVRQWAAFPKASPPDLILVNPSVADRHGRANMRQTLCCAPQTLLAALLYGYAGQDELEQYDCTVDIDLPKDALIRKLQHALQNRSAAAEPAQGNADLSDREKEILTSLVEGHTNKEIAAIHNLSVHTVISHRKNISRKTGIKTVSGLTVFALLNHLIKTGDGRVVPGD